MNGFYVEILLHKAQTSNKHFHTIEAQCYLYARPIQSYNKRETLSNNDDPQ